MRRANSAYLALLLATPPALSQPAQQDPTPLLLTIFHQLRSGTLDRSLLGPELSADTSADDLAQARAALTQFGEPTAIRVDERRTVATGMVYVYAATFPTGTFRVSIYITRDGKVGGYRLL